MRHHKLPAVLLALLAFILVGCGGDVYVEEAGFELMSDATIDESATVTGETAVATAE